MNGTGPSPSNQSETASSKIAGANGRNDSRRLIFLLRISFMSERRGSQSIDQLPTAPDRFHATLTPPDHLAIPDCRRALRTQLLLIRNVLDTAASTRHTVALLRQEIGDFTQ